MNGKHQTVFNDTGIDVSPAIVMQYTGVDDVRGQELFEGDVVEVVTQVGLSGFFTITWVPGKYALCNEHFLKVLEGTQIFKLDLTYMLSVQERNLGHMLKKGNVYEGADDQKVLPGNWPGIIRK